MLLFLTAAYLQFLIKCPQVFDQAKMSAKVPDPKRHEMRQDNIYHINSFYFGYILKEFTNWRHSSF